MTLLHTATQLLLLSSATIQPELPGQRFTGQHSVPSDGLCTTLGVTRQAMIGHDDSVNCLDALPERPLLISGSDDGSARMWDLRTLQCVLGFEARLRPGAIATPVNSIAISPAYEHLLYAASGPAVLLFDMRMPAVEHPVMVMVQETASSAQSLGDQEISQISMHPSGHQLAAVDEGGGVSIVHLNHGDAGDQIVTRLATQHRSLGSCVCWRSLYPQLHNQVFSGGFDMKVILHKLDDRRQDEAEPPVEFYMNERIRGRRSTRKKTNAGQSQQGTMSGDIFELGDSQGVPVINPPFVHALDTTYDGRTLAVACGDGALRTYSLNPDGSVERFSQRAFQRHRRRTTCVAFPRVSAQYRCLTGVV
jgi:WD40 repeat protein